MSQSVTRLVVLIALGAAAAVAGLIVTSSVPTMGSEERSSNVQLLDQALRREPRSAKFRADGQMKVEGPGAAKGGGAVAFRIAGAFGGNRKGGRPSGVFDGRVQAGGQSFGVGMTLVQERVFFGFNGVNYELPRGQARRVFDQPRTAGNEREMVALLGFDLRDWFENVQEDGTARVDGVVTRRVTADVDGGRVADDLFRFASERSPTGSPSPQLTAQSREQLQSSLKALHADVYVGQSDGIVRRVVITGDLEAENGSGRFNFDLRLSDVNKPQRIAPPANVKPFSQLQSDLSSGLLRGLVGGSTRPTPAPAPAPSAPPASAAGAPAVPQETQPYLACVRRAGTKAELQRCEPLLR